MSFRASDSESRNRRRPERVAGPSTGMMAIPRLRAFGAPLGMTTFLDSACAPLGITGA